jgi:hypothetical protein
MNFDEAVRRAIEAYWDGIEPEKSHKSMQGRPKYTKKFFDKFESKQFGSLTQDELNGD